MVSEEQVLELRQRVAQLERQVEFLLTQLKLTYVDQPYKGVDPDIAELVGKGQLIEAIKLYREKTGAGLREAKDFIESLKI